jgi:hexosaminidase
MNGLLIFRASNPGILKFMEAQNITGDFQKLEEIYIQRIIEIASNLSANSVVWQEVFDNEVIMPQDTVVHIWKDNMEEELAKVRQSDTVN